MSFFDHFFQALIGEPLAIQTQFSWSTVLLTWVKVSSVDLHNLLSGLLLTCLTNQGTKHMAWRMSWEIPLKTKHFYHWLGTWCSDVPSLSRACKMCLNVVIVPSTTAVVCYICQWHRACVFLLLRPLIPISILEVLCRHTAPWNLISWSKSKQPQALVHGLEVALVTSVCACMEVDERTWNHISQISQSAMCSWRWDFI